MATNPLDPTGAIAAGIVTVLAGCQQISAAISAPATPVPVIVPIPPVVLPPTPISVTPVVSDDFTKYANTAALQAVIAKGAGGLGTAPLVYNDGWNAGLVSLDPTVLYKGHPTAKFSMPGGVQTCPKLIAPLPTPLDIVWFRTKVRFSPGFTTTGTNSGANAFKLLAWGHTNYDGSGRLEITNTTQYVLYWDVIHSGTELGGGQVLVGGSVNTEWVDGQWYNYILKLDRSQTTKGFASAWWGLDTQVPTFKGITPPETMQNGTNWPQINTVAWAIEFNQVRLASQAQAIWLGAWDVVDGIKHPNPYGLVGG